MPVVFRDNGLRYYFFSNVGQPPEPMHVHVNGGSSDTKIWVEPIVCMISRVGLHWETLDEDISIAGLLAGRGDVTKPPAQVV